MLFQHVLQHAGACGAPPDDDLSLTKACPSLGTCGQLLVVLVAQPSYKEEKPAWNTHQLAAG